MRNTIHTLAAAWGGTGRENEIAAVIRGMVAPYVDEISADALGSLICHRRGEGRRVMIAAHMDHIGFIVTDIEKEGFLRVHNVGGVRVANSLNRHVVFENGVHGLVSNETRDFENTMPGLFIDIGASSREEAEERVSIGDVAVYAPDVFDMGGCVAGPAMDDRAGCAVLVEALRRLQHPKSDIWAVFTTQEEVGLRGARAAAYAVDPQVGIALDVTLSGDTPKGPRISVALGKGVAVKILDSSLIATPALVRALEAAARREGIPWQREVLTAGGTDAGAIHLTRSGVPACTLSIPCRYVHSGVETVSVADCEAAARLLSAVLESGEL